MYMAEMEKKDDVSENCELRAQDPRLTSHSMGATFTECCNIPLSRIPDIHGLSPDPEYTTCKGNFSVEGRRTTVSGDTTMADEEWTPEDAITVISGYSNARLFVVPSLFYSDGIMMLSSGDGTEITKKKAISLAHAIARHYGEDIHGVG